MRIDRTRSSPAFRSPGPITASISSSAPARRSTPIDGSSSVRTPSATASRPRLPIAWRSRARASRASCCATWWARTPSALAHGAPTLADVHAWSERAIATQAASGFEAHDYLYQSWAYEAHDVGTTPGFGGDTRRALGAIRASTLVLAPQLDLFNP